MPFTEDFAQFFNRSEFASGLTIGGAPVNGIFDAEYQLQDFASGVMSGAPVVTLASADVPANVVSALVVVNAVTYKVVEAMPNGTGITILRLRK